MLLRISFLFSLLGNIISFVCAQTTYKPIVLTKDEAWTKTFNQQIATYNYSDFLKEIPTASVKEAKSLIESSRKQLSTSATNNQFFVKTELNTYINLIYKEIAANNPSIDTSQIRLLISRQTDVNAVSYGEGTLALNLGLLGFAQNESQIAFVICHEIAHFKLKHYEKQVKNYLNVVYSDEFKKKVKKIQSSEYGQTKEVVKLLESISLKASHHSRKDEKQADSLGAIFMSNTRFDTKEIITCLTFLDSSDYRYVRQDLALKKTFDSPSYPFSEDWLTANDEGMAVKQKTTEEQKKLEDSLLTHPDCKKRIGYLTLKPKPGTKANLQKTTDFQKMVLTSQFEMIQSEYDFGNVGECLFETLILLKTHPNNTFLHTMVGKCLAKLYTAQKEHTVRNIVDLPSVFQKENYRQLVTFLENLRMSETANIGYYYLHDRLAQNKDEAFYFQLYLNAKNTSDPEKIASAKKYYTTSFPSGIHASEIQ